MSAPVAGHLDVILYSREQLVQEYADMPVKGQGGELPPAPWGIISIKVTDASCAHIAVCFLPGFGNQLPNVDASECLEQHAGLDY